MARWAVLVVAAAILVDSWIEDGSDVVQVERGHSAAPAYEVSETAEHARASRRCPPPGEGRRERPVSLHPPAPARTEEPEASPHLPTGIAEFLSLTHTYPS